MFGLFKKKSEEEILQKEYDSLMKEWHELSSINRAESDKKYAEAQRVSQKLEVLMKK